MNNSSSFVHSLLSNLKLIVELVIKFPGDSLTFQYGAIERIRSAILAILSHGFKQTSEDIYDNIWQLIVRLNSNSEKHIHLLQEVYHKDNSRLTVEQWIDQSVITHCLSQQLSSIENDSDLLENYYNSHAFMRMIPFYHAFLICIRTIETNDPSLLANIDPKLSIGEFNHAIPLINDVTCRSYSSTIPPTLHNNNNNNLSTDDSEQKCYSINKQRISHRRIHSDPVLRFETKSTNPFDISSSDFLNEFKANQEENLSNISFPIEYGSSYDLHAVSSVSIEQSLPIDINRQSVSSQITIIDTKEKEFNQSTRLPYSSLFWPRKGQTLDNYIRECDSQTRTDVEKENAHFYFSEAIISAIEYIKFSEKCKKYFEPIDENFSELNNFNQNLNTNSEDLSAETMALQIMEIWKNYKIPTAIDLFWMIPHEEEISVELTPIQDNKSIDRNDDYVPMEGSERVLRRGNNQWAPPREQLIFHIHPAINRDIQLKKQGDLCAGCGRDVEKGYAHRFRYCEYTGKYFCRSCHSDKKFYLPSYIITKWDFSNKHSVSNFAYDYLNRIYTEPIFHLNDLNPKLFERSNKLRMVNEFRWALYSLQYYILTCRFAEQKGLRQNLLALPSYIYEQPHTYSLQDLIKTKLRELQKILEPIVMNLREHVFNCTLCYAKGFICEICNNEKSILFSFNIQTTSVCPICQSCFHIQCHKNQKYVCPKCQRAKRRNSLSSSNQLPIPTNAS